MKVGDYLQIGKRLHMVIAQDVDSDDQATGPSIFGRRSAKRRTMANSPTGLFRLKSNKRSWTVGPNRLFSVSCEVKEAL